VGSSGSKRRKPKQRLPKVEGRFIDPPLDGVGPWSPSSIHGFGWRMVRAARYGSPKQKRAITIIWLAPFALVGIILLVSLVVEAIND
jgi:hypothetical protein